MDGRLYDTDFFTWTQEQAAALRRPSPHADSAGLDLANLIEEVETLGRSEVAKVRSALFRLMEHAALVALADTDHRDAAHRRGETVAFRADAEEDYRPSMRQLLEPRLERLWLQAREAATRKLHREPGSLPEALPFTLDGLLRDLPLDDPVAALRAAPPQG